jgi:aminopeptidase
MVDSRVAELAEILVGYSTEIHKDDYVQLLTSSHEGIPLFRECYRRIIQSGAYVFTHIGFPGQDEIFYKYASNEQIKYFPDLLMEETKRATAYIRIGAPSNTRELSAIAPDKMTERSKAMKPILDERVDNTRWVATMFPTNAAAQDAGMSLEDYEDFFYSATNRDWVAESKIMHEKKKVFDAGKIVRIKSPDTDLEMSLNGRLGVASDGKKNMPDGELYFAPLETYTKGHIKFTYPSRYGGRDVEGIRLEFKDGKVIKATAEKNEDMLTKVVNTDADARLIGEFAIGMNWGVQKFTNNLLFDEKIGGTIHIAIGRAYKECGGKSESAIHWDIVKDMRNDGEIFVDGKLVQKNGKWI